MSGLQLLKFSYRNDRLNFTSDWIATEEEFSIDNITPQVVEELMAAGKYSELAELLATSETATAK
ncbi:hypothetical protein FRC03_006934 [Tulasnella sp. 419]|nr:hypothetical protein FRC03_006934 [Tulasnella sp. 419]